MLKCQKIFGMSKNVCTFALERLQYFSMGWAWLLGVAPPWGFPTLETQGTYESEQSNETNMIREVAIVVTKESSLLKPFGCLVRGNGLKTPQWYKQPQRQVDKETISPHCEKKNAEMQSLQGFPPNRF